MTTVTGIATGTETVSTTGMTVTVIAVVPRSAVSLGEAAAGDEAAVGGEVPAMLEAAVGGAAAAGTDLGTEVVAGTGTGTGTRTERGIERGMVETGR